MREAKAGQVWRRNQCGGLYVVEKYQDRWLTMRVRSPGHHPSGFFIFEDDFKDAYTFVSRIDDRRLEIIRDRNQRTLGRIQTIVQNSGRLTTRRTGRTTAAIAHARANGGWLVAATAGQAESLKRQAPDVKVVCVETLKNLGAVSEPVVFDHFAYEMYLASAASAIEEQSAIISDLIEELEEAKKTDAYIRSTLAVKEKTDE